MSRDARQLLTAVTAGSAMIAALFAAPIAAAEPFGPGTPMPSNCLPGPHAQIVYCDEDMNPDGSWVRCWQPKPKEIMIQGGIAGDVPGGPMECRLVTLNSLPAASPPYHIGYGG